MPTKSAKTVVRRRPAVFEATSFDGNVVGMRPLLSLILALVIAFPTAGCTKAADGVSQAESVPEYVGQDTPPIHLEQTEVVLKNGVSPIEKMYRDALAACRKVPTMPTTPLSEEVASKLGRTYWSIWYMGTRMAAKIDEWNYANAASPCRFESVHEARLWIIDEKGRSTTIDLNNGKAETEQLAPGRQALDSQDLEGVTSNGEIYMGQRCVRRSDTLREECVWSGGHQWGFATDLVSVDSGYDRGDHIVLWSKPVNGNGTELTTQSMTVGTPIDDKVFKLPSNIAISKAQ